MADITWQAERINLKNMIKQLDGRMIVAIGVANGAEARQLHHTIYELYDQNAVPDYIGGFVTYASGYLCSAANGLPDMGYILRPDIVRQTDIIEQSTWMAALDSGRPAFPIGWTATPDLAMSPLQWF
jgi:2-methylisocitrate lyase-like PEP mutase family enzyme